MNNRVTDLIKNHRSIRSYTNEPIKEEVLSDILGSAQWASSSHNVQAYSIIVIKKTETKDKLSKLCGSQEWISSCPVFLVFCLDFSRLTLACNVHETKHEIDEIENLLIGTIDTSLVAQNVLLGAESHGLGGVFIGGLRNNLDEVIKLLNIPQYVVPLMGMCLGYPNEVFNQKPRLPMDTVVHKENYSTINLMKNLEEYEEVTANYYNERTNGKVTIGWLQQMSEYLNQIRRPDIMDIIVKQGFKLK